MAELNTGGKKATPRVDMTPMVDLMFLLVTFFILTTSISTPQAMDIVKPDQDDNNQENRLELKASKTMTILLGKNDKVAWYMGKLVQQLQRLRIYLRLKKRLSITEKLLTRQE